MQAPFISADHVRAALDAMLYTASAPPPNPLRMLALIDEALANPDFPPFEQDRELALQEILVKLIIRELTLHRRALDLNLPPADTTSLTMAQAQRDLEADARNGSKELLSWSLLYYRYVCVQFNLTLDTIRGHLIVDERSVRRYYTYAVRRLAMTLAEEEGRARTRQRKRQLLAELPAPVDRPMIGRGGLLQSLTRAIADSPPHHFFVTGASGIGKTTLIQEFLRDQINAEAILQMIWLNEPPSVAFTREQIEERLHLERMTIPLRNYLLINRIAVIIDGVHTLFDEPDELEKLLQDLSPALVVLISGQYQPMRTAYRHVVVTELEQGEVLTLVDAEVGNEYKGDQAALTDLAASAWEMVGGNPLAVKLLARNVELFEPDADLQHRLLDNLYGRTYAALNNGQRRAWMMFALMPPGTTRLTLLHKLWPHFSQPSLLRPLAERHLIEKIAPGEYLLPQAATQFLQTLASSNHEAWGMLNELVEALDHAVDQRESLPVIEHLLLAGWPAISAERQRHWTRAAWRAGIPQGHCTRWRSILETGALVNFAEMRVVYGMCLRRLGRWTEAEQALDSAIAEAGQEGAFIDQARAMLEMAILQRQYGIYERSLRLINRVQETAQRLRDDELAQLARLERAQIAVDHRQYDAAMVELAPLRDSMRVLGLKAEIFLALGDFWQGYQLAEQALDRAGGDPFATARLHSIIARGYEVQGDFEHARDHHVLALAKLEQLDDDFALARAQCNLAAVLMQLDEDEDAFGLLERAADLQYRLGDQTGLTVTTHNLNHARIKIATRGETDDL